MTDGIIPKRGRPRVENKKDMYLKVRLTNDDYQLFKIMAKDNNTFMSKILRDIVKEQLKQYRKANNLFKNN